MSLSQKINANQVFFELFQKPTAQDISNVLLKIECASEILKDVTAAEDKKSVESVR